MIPSTTHSGSVLPVMEAVPRIRIFPPDTLTPGVLPCNASVIPPGDFNTSFGDEYIAAIREMKLDTTSVNTYTEDLPGIYITVDDPISEGGRINIFELPLKVSDETYYITGNYAELKFRSDYGNRHDVDSSFLFFFGAADMQVYEDTENEYVTPSQTSQSALNLADDVYLMSKGQIVFHSSPQELDENEEVKKLYLGL